MPESKYPLSLVIRAVDKVTAPLQEINTRLEKSTSRLSAPFRRLGNRLGALGNAAGLPKLGEAFKGVGESARSVGSAALGLGKTIAGMVGGALFGGYGLYALAKGALDVGDSLGEQAQRVGLGVDAFAQLQFAAAQADVGPEAFAASMDKLNKSLGDAKAGGGKLLGFLEKVSPTLARQVKGAKDTESALGLLTKAFEKVTDPSKRAALAAAAFGESGLQMGQFLGQGSKAINEQRQRFLQLAGSQQSLVDGAGNLDNAMREAETAFLGLRNATMTALFPALTRLSTAVADFVAKHREALASWAEKAGKAITAWVEGGGIDRLAAGLQSLASTVGSIVEKLGGLEGVAKLVALAMSANLISSTAGLAGSLVNLGAEVAPLAYKLGSLLVSALGKAAVGILEFNFAPLLAGLGSAIASVWGFTAALLANPITWIVVGIAALAGAAYLIYKNWGPIKEWFGKLWEGIKSAVGSALQWVGKNLSWTPLGMLVNNWEPVKAFFVDLWDGIVSAFQKAWGFIKPIVDKVSDAMKLGPIGMAVQGFTMAREALFGGPAGDAGATAASALPPGPMASEAKVTVDFANLPRGARVQPAQDNTANLDLGLGYSMVSP